MIPLRDDQPTFSTPFINYFLIVLNLVVFLWELSIGMQSHRALNSVMFEFGVVPHHELAVLTGTPYLFVLQFLKQLEARGEVNVREFLGGSSEITVSPTLRRLL